MLWHGYTCKLLWFFTYGERCILYRTIYIAPKLTLETLYAYVIPMNNPMA